VFTSYPDSPPSILGKLTTGLTVTVEIWRSDQLLELPEGAEMCPEVGDTGIYAFSTVHLPPTTRAREQYHFRMTGRDDSTDEGDFILEAEDIDALPSLNDRDSYMVKP
jgi:hypothetical protein